METLFDLFLHLDRHLAEFTALYGPWIYAVLFLIIFAETGLIVTPFLPGDSLLFAAGALAATGALDMQRLCVLLVAAAILGDAVNYAAGRFAGARVLSPGAVLRFWRHEVRQEHLQRAHTFFERFGGAAVVMGRFAPIVRTFVPFVAGAVSMSYSRFAFYNITGAVAWIGLCAGAGYAFGNAPGVKEHFSIIVLGIVLASCLPLAVGVMRRSRQPECAQ